MAKHLLLHLLAPFVQLGHVDASLLRFQRESICSQVHLSCNTQLTSIESLYFIVFVVFGSHPSVCESELLTSSKASLANCVFAIVVLASWMMQSNDVTEVVRCCESHACNLNMVNFHPTMWGHITSPHQTCVLGFFKNEPIFSLHLHPLIPDLVKLLSEFSKAFFQTQVLHQVSKHRSNV